MRSTVINILLILVLGITILPIAQVGSLLYNNVLTEERSNAEDGGISSGKKADFAEPAEIGTGIHFAELSTYLNSAGYIHFAETLPPSHAGDIHSPPPNA